MVHSENPYILLTPGPLSTSASVKAVMLRDWCTWDDDYNQGVVQKVRKKLVSLATQADGYTSVLMQGSGTFCVESVIGSVIPRQGKILVLANGAYGDRFARIVRTLGINMTVHSSGELGPTDLDRASKELEADSDITHIGMIHGETTTGMLNPIGEIGALANEYGKVFIVDAMSTFGGVPMDLDSLHIDYLISSANKCIQGVPGFGFILARQEELEKTDGFARSHSLDLFDQWRTMELGNGKWRFTSPTHTVRAFAQALLELDAEGGVEKRYQRYCENHRILVEGMERLGFECVLPHEHQSPIITGFRNPSHEAFEFLRFYNLLKERGFVIYPGKVTDIDSFRIGTIGNVFPNDFERLIQAVEESMYWRA